MELVRMEVPWQPLYLAPLGDIQWSGDKHEIALDDLHRHIDEMMELGAWFIGMGDYIDFMSPSNRFAIQAAKLHERTRTTIQDKALELTDDLVQRILKPTIGRWIGLHEGHHFANLDSGETSDMTLARLLKTRHLGTQALTNLVFKREGASETPTAHGITVWSWHGQGGGQAIHAPLMKLAGLAQDWEDVDIFLIGHMTKIATAPLQRLRGNWRAKPYRLSHRSVRLVGTGGWLKALVERRREGKVPRGGYVEKAGLRPVELGAPHIRIVPRVEGANKVWAPDMKAIA